MKNNLKATSKSNNSSHNKAIFVVLVVVAFLLAGAIGLSFSDLLFPVSTAPTDNEYAGASLGDITPNQDPTFSSCTDTDGGKDYFVKGKCYEFNLYRGEDLCLNSSVCLEFYCNSNNKCVTEQIRCSKVNGSNGECSNGRCKRIPSPMNCSDSDGGIVPFVKGTVRYQGSNGMGKDYPDACFGDSLVEYFCQFNLPTSTMIECGEGCGNSACLINPATTSNGQLN
jgi:hypothetical protein